MLVRQISSGLYWNRNTGWGAVDEAHAFSNSGEAILHCIESNVRDVHVILDFGDPAYDVVLHPFGENGHEPSSHELLEGSRQLKVKNAELAARTKALLAGAHQTIAEIKERKKRRPFKPKPAAEE